MALINGYTQTMRQKGWHSRGYLPHFDSQETIQFVTFRLADSLPQQALARISDAAHPESLRDEILDAGLGACWLRSEPVARIVEESFFTFDDERYRLCAWTIMPNHVHVLFTVLPGQSLGHMVGSWKRFTARQANKHLGREGQFWQADYWDRFIRNEAHFGDVVNYIDLNPVKAGLANTEASWPYGSARFRT